MPLNSLTSFLCPVSSIEGVFRTTFLTCSQGVREISDCCGEPAGVLACAGAGCPWSSTSAWRIAPLTVYFIYFPSKGCSCMGYMKSFLFTEMRTILTLCVLIRNLKELQNPSGLPLQRIFMELKQTSVCSSKLWRIITSWF